jgi:hypothetical protein
MNGMALFWAWLLKYSAFLGSGLLSVLVAWYIDRFIARRAKLVFYTSHPQWVTLAPQQGQPPIAPIETFSLFIFNQGKAPAREVHVGHYFLPACNVYPDIPRDIVQTPGGGTAIRFPVIPPRTLITISYLVFGNFTVDNIVSYVGSEEGAAQRIPVMLQRIFPQWAIRLTYFVFLLGAWVLLNASFSLIHYLWVTFYK